MNDDCNMARADSERNSKSMESRRQVLCTEQSSDIAYQ
jgi:hypothetical protein